MGANAQAFVNDYFCANLHLCESDGQISFQHNSVTTFGCQWQVVRAKSVVNCTYSRCVYVNTSSVLLVQSCGMSFGRQ